MQISDGILEVTMTVCRSRENLEYLEFRNEHGIVMVTTQKFPKLKYLLNDLEQYLALQELNREEEKKESRREDSEV